MLAQDEILFTLASHALQADLGDLNPEIHRKNYFNVQDYFPAWVGRSSFGKMFAVM